MTSERPWKPYRDSTGFASFRRCRRASTASFICSRPASLLVILLPITAETRGLVGTDLLSGLKPGALVVNASRGAVVDTPALMAALTNGRIRAALDVTDPEPLPDGHPLWSMPGVLITPHVAGDVSGEEDRAWALVADQVARLARG